MKCPNCGFDNTDSAIYCANCGSSMSAGAPTGFNSAPTSAGSDGFSPYTPPVNPTVQPTDYTNSSMYGYTPTLGTLPDPKKNALAIIGFILGILSVMCCCFSMLIFPLVFALLGLIFGIVGLKSEKKGLAVAAVIISGIGLLSGIIFLVLFLAGGGYEAFLEEFEQAYQDALSQI